MYTKIFAPSGVLLQSVYTHQEVDRCESLRARLVSGVPGLSAVPTKSWTTSFVFYFTPLPSKIARLGLALRVNMVHVQALIISH